MSLSGHILIIDDDATVRQTLAQILQREKLDVTTATSGEDGLAFLAQQLVDLVYLDIRMPGMSGLDVLKDIRVSFPEVPVILFTAQPDLSSAIEALRHGAIDYLLKPLRPQVFIDRTMAVLTHQQKERRKRELQTNLETIQAELKSLDNDEISQQEEAQSRIKGSDERFLTRGKLTLDLHTHRLVIGERTENLPPATFNYLLVLMRHSPNVVDYQTLVSEGQGYQASPREAQGLVKWHIHHIRQIIEPDVHNPIYLINIRRTGYRLTIDEVPIP